MKTNEGVIVVVVENFNIIFLFSMEEKSNLK